MTIPLAKIESEVQTRLQHEIHTPLDENDELTSPFCYQYEKTTWHTHMPIRITSSGGESEGKLSFSLNTAFDYIQYTVLRQELPMLRVKKEYEGKVEICWCHNVGHKLIREAEFKDGDETLPGFDDVWLDIHAQYTYTDVDKYNKRIGNISSLEQWNTVLPRYRLRIPQPWFYSQSRAHAYPLLLRQGVSVSHQYTLRNRISELLRMRMLVKQNDDDEGVWKHIDVNLDYIDGQNIDGILKQPELWGRYVYLSSIEREAVRCKTKYQYYIDNIVNISSLNPHKLGQRVALELDCSYPCKAFFWVAQDIDAERLRCHGNYTTDLENVYNGWSPVETFSLQHSGGYKIKDMEADYFEDTEALYHCSKIPHDKGYFIYSISQEPFKASSDTGSVFSVLKAKAFFKLNITDPMNSIKKDNDAYEEDVKNMYHIHSRLLTIRRLSFTYNQEKKSYDLSFEDE